MRLDEHIVNKVDNINRLRTDKNKELALLGEEPLEAYEFNYLLLCNKICGVSHYNMQMDIIVESEEEYKAWLAEQPTLTESLNKG